jgi:hypothetical protein
MAGNIVEKFGAGFKGGFSGVILLRGYGPKGDTDGVIDCKSII